MSLVVRMLTWTAIVALPGGLLLLPVVLADRYGRRSTELEPSDAPAPTPAPTPVPTPEI